MYSIQNYVEPSRLRLIWQSIDERDRNKYHVADLARAGSSVALYYRTMSPDFVQAMLSGFRGHPAFDVRIPVHHHNVLEIFMKRLPPRNRSDFWTFLNKNGLGNHPSISNFALLGYAGARLPGDGFSLEIDFSLETAPFDFFSEVAGFRHYQGMQLDMEALRGQPVLFVPEPTNPKDPNAVEVYALGTKIGYIPRSQAPLFKAWLAQNNVHAWLARIEGAPAKPLVLIFVMVAQSRTVLTALTKQPL